MVGLIFIFLANTMSGPQMQVNASRSTICIAVYLMSEVVLTMEVEKNVTVQQIIHIIQSDTELGLARSPPIIGQPVFALWLSSFQLELQLKPSHR